MTPTQTIAATGFMAFCAAVSQNPMFSFGLMALISIACITVIIHTALACWKLNRQLKRQQEVRNARRDRNNNVV